jgi:drug/metabolite transporter (DMT)-like permease
MMVSPETFEPPCGLNIRDAHAPNLSRTSNNRAVYVGILLVTLAALFWSLNGALIKIVNQDGQGPGGVAIAFYRSLVAGLFLLPFARGRWRTLRGAQDSRFKHQEWTRPDTRRFFALQAFKAAWLPWLPRPAAIWCAIFFTLMTAFFVVANTMTQAANVIILQYTSTFWIFGLSPMVLNERPRSSDLWILALAFAGIVIIFAGNASAHAMGLTIALASGLFYALLTMMIRRLRDADSAAVTVFNNLVAAALLLPVVVAAGGLGLTLRSLLLLIFMGVVQFGLPYYLYTLGLARIPAYQAALITMLEPVLVPCWSYLAIGKPEAPSAWTVAGGAVILFALLLFVHAARRSSPGLSEPRT